ncbi:hypothetical protein [Nitrospirillum pindoramense]|uniref:Uncharacterized protein n=1 Tax=Nitrospirillum amazonense TaxID=28077 RepID=A0A560GQR0_9PROT|nr:hypothetical protein [Nitrospirillum amazonense]TWB35820.1 hypothetical protein FBZ90_11820 [Nitrospirillum amazonense]
MRKSILAAGFLAACLFDPAHAADSLQDAIKTANAQGHAVKSITPIFSQLVMFSIPAGFQLGSEHTQGNQYIREMVLEGETLDRWTQMITITGFQGLGANPNVTPQGFAAMLAGRFKNACPTTFAAKEVANLTISGQPAFIAWISCGTAPGGDHSESAVIFSIKGANDYYTLQWAEREAASSQPMAFDDAKWKERIARLNPVKICPIIPGEQAPYPSCVDQK